MDRRLLLKYNENRSKAPFPIRLPPPSRIVHQTVPCGIAAHTLVCALNFVKAPILQEPPQPQQGHKGRESQGKGQHKEYEDCKSQGLGRGGGTTMRLLVFPSLPQPNIGLTPPPHSSLPSRRGLHHTLSCSSMGPHCLSTPFQRVLAHTD